jgi:hypothetical protein
LQAGQPPVAGADGGAVGEQAGFFFLLGEAGEFGVQRVSGVQEGFFAVQDRWIEMAILLFALHSPLAPGPSPLLQVVVAVQGARAKR